MRRLLALASLLAACARPTPSVRGNLAHDQFVPAASPIGRLDEALMSGDGPDGRLLLFLDFDGADILRVANDVVSENSADNASWIPNTYPEGQTKALAPFDASPYVGFTDATARQLVVDRVAGWYAELNVDVVSARPASGRYTMIMIGDQTSSFLMGGSSSDGTIGMATLDCGNASEINVGFAFAQTIASMQTIASSADAETALLAVAQTVAHEAGHTFGLEHVNDPQDIMSPAVDPSVVGFVDTANALSSPPSSCDGASTENTHTRLLANLGPAPVAPDLSSTPDLSTPASDLARGGVGASCMSSMQCESGVCANGNDAQFCTTSCASRADCPASFTCASIDGEKFCVPEHAHGCDYGGGSPSVLGLFLFLFLRRRSSRPSAT